MFTVEFKVNGKLVAYIYGINKGFPSGKATPVTSERVYEYEVTEDIDKDIPTERRGRVIHGRHHGLLWLIEAIIRDAKGGRK